MLKYLHGEEEGGNEIQEYRQEEYIEEFAAWRGDNYTLELHL